MVGNTQVVITLEILIFKVFRTIPTTKPTSSKTHNLIGVIDLYTMYLIRIM
jgi:hypothetical protein